jgi:hypothetical protein
LFVAEHAPHAPLPRQTGAVDGHSASLAQARQTCVVELQVGAVPEQFVSVRHDTHTWATSS